MYYGYDVRPEFKVLLECLDVRNYTAVDLCCGQGRYSLFLAGYVKRVDAVDFSSVAINKLKKTAEYLPGVF